jgi:hypothetical protein
MIMKSSYLLLICVLVVLSACTKDNDPIIDISHPVPENALNLSDLKEGQKSLFIKYISTCDSLEEKFEYTRDTLVVEVVKQAGDLYLKEYFTEHSPMYLDTFISNEPIYYPITGIENNVLIPERVNSSLFYFYGNDTIRLNRQHDVNLVQQGCKLMIDSNPFIGDEIGVVQNFQFGAIDVKNKTVVSCVPPMILNTDAYLIYSNEQLFLSHTVTIVEFWGSIVEYIAGWELLEP